MFFNNSSSSIKLSVLDQSVATSDHSHDKTLQNTLELAGFCEELGYNRFWVSVSIIITPRYWEPHLRS